MGLAVQTPRERRQVLEGCGFSIVCCFLSHDSLLDCFEDWREIGNAPGSSISAETYSKGDSPSRFQRTRLFHASIEKNFV